MLLRNRIIGRNFYHTVYHGQAGPKRTVEMAGSISISWIAEMRLARKGYIAGQARPGRPAARSPVERLSGLPAVMGGHPSPDRLPAALWPARRGCSPVQLGDPARSACGPALAIRLMAAFQFSRPIPDSPHPTPYRMQGNPDGGAKSGHTALLDDRSERQISVRSARSRASSTSTPR
jgi:hypothetical protein